MTKNLFPELEFTRENVLAWAYEQVALEPVIVRGDIHINNSTVVVLRDALSGHYMREFLQYDKSDLLCEVMTHIHDGVDKPLNSMEESELLDEVMQLCTPQKDGLNVFEFETMDDFVRDFVGGD